MRCGLEASGPRRFSRSFWYSLKLPSNQVPGTGVLVGALPRENVCGDAVEEPSVVARDDRAAREFEQRLFQALERLGVEVVRRLVEQQEVAALLERKCEVQAVALAAGQHARGLLLVGPLEAKRGAT